MWAAPAAFQKPAENALGSNGLTARVEHLVEVRLTTLLRKRGHKAPAHA